MTEKQDIANIIDRKIEFLKFEMQSIDNIIARIDTITQGIKNWSVVTWAGSIGIIIGISDLRPFIFLTALLPLLFWYIDASWRKLQRRSAYRANKIRDFLNSESFIKSCKENDLIEFNIYDPVGRLYKNLEEYKEYISVKRTLKFPEVMFFYLAQIVVSIILEILFSIIK